MDHAEGMLAFGLSGSTRIGRQRLPNREESNVTIGPRKRNQPSGYMTEKAFRRGIAILVGEH